MKFKKSFIVVAVLLTLLDGAVFVLFQLAFTASHSLGDDGERRLDSELIARIKRAEPNHVHFGRGIPEFPSTDSFSLVMQTFNRTDLLLKLLSHYVGLASLLEIIVVWNNEREVPPSSLLDSLRPYPVGIQFHVPSRNLVRNRFSVYQLLKTDAVFFVDDDLRISAQDVEFAFGVWKQNPHKLVGFTPRKHVRKNGVYVYASEDAFGLRESTSLPFGASYSLILTGASFVHRKYLAMFIHQMPDSILDEIDRLQNCEDIAFNFMVADYLKDASGLYVKAAQSKALEQDAASGYQGLWKQQDHVLERSACLNKFAKAYGHMPLQYSNVQVSHFRFPEYFRAL